MRRPEECFPALQSGYYSILRQTVADLVLCITKCYNIKIVQVYAPTKSYSEEDINSFYNGIDENLGKRSHYTIVMGDINAQIGTRTNPMEIAVGKFGLELRQHQEYKIMNSWRKQAGDERGKAQTV